MIGKKIKASIKHVILAKMSASRDSGLEFATIGWNPTNRLPIIPKINPFFNLPSKTFKKSKQKLKILFLEITLSLSLKNLVCFNLIDLV
jgi:hypothetical protein